MRLHVEALSEVPHVKIVGVADPRLDAARALANTSGVDLLATDYRDLLANPAIDAVDIAIPHDRHVEVCTAAIAANKHVFMDKPMASTVDGARRLHEVVTSSTVTFMLCHNLIFHPAVTRAKRLLSTGFLGRLTTCRAWSRGWLDLGPGDFRLSRESTGGGAWIDSASHFLCVLEELCGQIDTIALLPSRGESRLEAEDSASAVARFRCGATAAMQVSYAESLPGRDRGWPDGFEAGFELHGTLGYMLIELLPECRLSIFDCAQGLRSEDLPSAAQAFRSSFAGAINEFALAVRDNRPPRVTSADGLHVMELIVGEEAA